MPKECGECNWCCYHTAVPDLTESREWCKHASRMRMGCKIHSVRPKLCRTFRCVWLMDKVMPEEFRPDVCGVMIELPFQSSGMIAHVNPDRPDALENKWLGKLFGKLERAGYPVMISGNTSNDGSKLYRGLN